MTWDFRVIVVCESLKWQTMGLRLDLEISEARVERWLGDMSLCEV